MFSQDHIFEDESSHANNISAYNHDTPREPDEGFYLNGQSLVQYLWDQIRKDDAERAAQRMKHSQGEETEDEDGEASNKDSKYYIAYTTSMH